MTAPEEEADEALARTPAAPSTAPAATAVPSRSGSKWLGGGSKEVQALSTSVPAPAGAMPAFVAEASGELSGDGGSEAGGCGPTNTMAEAAAKTRSSKDATMSPPRGVRSIEGRS